MPIGCLRQNLKQYGMLRTTFFRWLAAFFLLANPFVEISAASIAESLTFMVNGKPIVIYLADRPVITYTENTLHIASTTEEPSGGGSEPPVVTVIDIPVQDITETIVDKTETGIVRPMVETPKMDAGKMLFTQLPAGSQVKIFSTDGKVVSTINVSSDEQALIDIKSLPKGIYVIKSDSQTIKITNK